MTIDSKERILGFDLARVISMVYMVLYHSLGYGNPLYTNSLIRTGAYLSLSIFTFQSGFLLASRCDLNKVRFFDFMKKRLLRIYPLFVISSMLLCVISFNTWSSTAKAWLGISPFWGPTPRTMWYVGVLLFFYSITLFWGKGGIRSQFLKFIIIMGVVSGIHFIFHSVDPRVFFYSSVYFVSIIIGQYFKERFFSLVTSWQFIIIISLLFISIAIVQLFNKSLLLTYGNSVLGMLSFFGIYICIGEKGKTSEKFVSVALSLSYATFCLYLFHREVFAFLLKLWQPDNPYYLFFYIGVLGLIITYPIAYYIQKGYDTIIQKINI